MKVKEDTLYKYLDIVLLESEITEPNSSMNILHEKYINPITDEERDEYLSITEGVTSLGVKIGYFEYLSKEKTWFDLTKKGMIAKSKGGHFKYLDFIEKKELEKIKPTIITENYIGGNNHGIQSSNSDFINPAIQKANKIKATKPPKRSFLEIASWVFGIVVAIIAIYEFIFKKL